MLLIMFLSGIVISIPYLFEGVGFISYIALVPFVWILIEKIPEMTKRRAYAYGLVFGLGYYIPMYYWFLHFYALINTMDVSEGTVIFLCILCWLGLALIQALEFGAVTLLYRIIRPKKEKTLICSALTVALWVLFEWQQSFFWRGVPWARLAVTQTGSLFALQSASIFGNLFVSALIVFINVLLYLAIREARKRLDATDVKSVCRSIANKKTAIFSALALGIFTLNILFGVIKVATTDVKSDTPVNVAVIQANISSYDNKGFYYSFDKYIEMTENCVSETGAKIVVWPETVLATEINKYKGVMAELQITARLNNIYLLVGAFDEKELDGVRQEYNAIYLFRPDGSVDEQRYYKRQLVPFGESNPLGAIAKILPFEIFDFFNDSKLVAGENPNLFDTEYGKIGATICFDSIYEYVTREATQEGAQIITLSTNDSWFSDSKAVYQHNRHAQIRAIENGRYIVRAASTGTSTVISPNGQVLTQIAPLTEGYTTYDVYALSDRTLYTYVGDLVAYISLAFVVGVVSFNIVNHFKNKKGVKNDDSSKS